MHLRRRVGGSFPPSIGGGTTRWAKSGAAIEGDRHHEIVKAVTRPSNSSKDPEDDIGFKGSSMRSLFRPRDAVSTFIAIAALLLGSGAGPAIAAENGPTVVELFTSQGCSSCPPANANLAALSERPDVLALSFSMTYWDRLGWKDTFGRADYTARQEAYEAPLGEQGPFTPQMVINGRKSLVGNDLGEVERFVAAARKDETGAGPTVTLSGGVVQISRGAAPRDGADVWLVRYDPRRIEVAVLRGENAGRALAHKNVVRDLSLVGRWMGDRMAVRTPQTDDGLRAAVIVQARGGGPVLAAATE